MSFFVATLHGKVGTKIDKTASLTNFRYYIENTKDLKKSKS